GLLAHDGRRLHRPRDDRGAAAEQLRPDATHPRLLPPPDLDGEGVPLDELRDAPREEPTAPVPLVGHGPSDQRHRRPRVREPPSPRPGVARHVELDGGPAPARSPPLDPAHPPRGIAALVYANHPARAQGSGGTWNSSEAMTPPGRMPRT